MNWECAYGRTVLKNVAVNLILIACVFSATRYYDIRIFNGTTSGTPSITGSVSNTTKLSEIVSVHPVVTSNETAVSGGDGRTSNVQVVSYRGNGTSPVCMPFFPQDQKIERIYFAHMRKAGGTTIRAYLQKVAKKYGLKLDVSEGRRAEAPGIKNNNTFYVTNLREPVDRSVSHWKYSFRWNCKDLSKAKKSGFRNITKEKSFEEYVQFSELKSRELCQSKSDRMSSKKRFTMWNCAINCYTRWFTDTNCVIDFNRSKKKAQAIISSYNLVIILEYLKKPEYVKAIEDIFEVGGFKPKGAFCARPSKKANDMYPPPPMSDETLKMITESNAQDIALYNELKHCPTGFNFPKFDEKYFY
uniref:Uncharacterized protein n=1 Tax=Corethron hystrix TaxID=216773 RepID=A0A7S1BY30_9STRA|mmetsp:Transcript_6468/g.13989  ORF Transcript_6468/g.13989 Transcript_6468/m.13989 type:complete len:358 (+) Transcript_6468:288-1361(+)